MTVGIDLGATFSRIACLGAEGRPVPIPDCSRPEAFLTPSVVHLARDAALVGTLAESLQEQHPRLPVIRFFKRQLGASCPVGYDYRGIPWYSEGVSALLLQKLAFDAEAHLGRMLEDVVVAVPPCFNDVQRRAVLETASLADVSVAGMVDAPAAAALHDAVANPADERVVLVLDFGGGGLDVAVATVDRRGICVLAKAGLADMGGKELDEQVLALILSQLVRAGCPPMPVDSRSVPGLRHLAEQVKFALCAPGDGPVRRALRLDGRAVEIDVPRADFESAVRECLNRAEGEAIACLWDAGLRPRDVHRVLLLGGSSRIPLVQERLRSLFGRPGQEVVHCEPGTGVACGAALHGSQLAGDAGRLGVPPMMRTITAHGVGVRPLDRGTSDAGVDVLVKRNTPLPVRVTTTCRPSRAFQDRIALDLVQLREVGDPAVWLGRLVVPLPASNGDAAVRLTLDCRPDGTVDAQVHDSCGRVLEQAFSRPGDDPGRHERQRSLVRASTVNDSISMRR